MPHRVHGLRRRRRGTQQIWIGLALSEIVSRGETERRHLLLADIIVDGIELESGERAKDDVDLVALDELLRLGLGTRRIATGICGDEIDFTAADRVVRLLQIGQNALLHLNAALRQRPGLYREEAKAKWFCLRDRRHRETGHRSGRPGDATGQNSTAAHFARLDLARHAYPPFSPSCGPRGRASRQFVSRY